MVRRKEAKTASLVIASVCLLLSLLAFFPNVDAAGTVSAVSLSRVCSFPARLVYPFFHVSVVHAVINCWCLLCIVFAYDVSLWYLFFSYLLAISIPPVLVCGQTVGLSAVCYGLMGMVSFQVRRKGFFHFWVLSLIAAGFAIPYICSFCGYSVGSPNSILHLYSYVAGLMVGFLNSPAHAKG